ncbi:T9SS type A sorting domain-containing protein [Chryseobacterium sp. 2987]|uniref:T9SS type A sorting domain-containing protein n=1 Tax=Chryseobacterium sp. 2987 TaxID=2817767 RepID=UPI0038D3570A
MRISSSPFTSIITIKGENLKSFELYDISGKLVNKGTLNEKTINLNNLVKGEYILKISTNNNRTTIKKIIKK